MAKNQIVLDENENLQGSTCTLGTDTPYVFPSPKISVAKLSRDIQWGVPIPNDDTDTLKSSTDTHCTRKTPTAPNNPNSHQRLQTHS
ncbi:hypothetical protein GQ457_01G013860 [Hibiscus cannabinus]